MSVTTDPFELVRRRAHVQGPTPLGEMPRLLEVLADDQEIDHLVWSAHFESAGDGVYSYPAMSLVCEARLAVPCIRCLVGIAHEIRVDRHFRLVRSDAEAAALDPDATDHDVMAVDADWHLLDILEDELLLALPLMPRHENCSLPATGDNEEPGTEAQADPERQFPFADLASQMKKPRD